MLDNRDQCLTAYHKPRKGFSKFYHRHSELIVKYNIGLKALLQQRISESVSLFLALQISISEILPWDRKSYLTQDILTRLSCIGCIGTHAHDRQVTSLLCQSDVIMWN